MATVGLKKTLNLHKYSVKIGAIISNWKFIIPLLFSIAGILFGSIMGKEEGGVYQKISEYFVSTVLNQTSIALVYSFLRALVLPTIFAAISFFCGLCVFGGFIVNTVPMMYGYIIGSISYYLYLNYSLKGLAYCMILIFPYAVLSLFSIILCSRESICMSECLIKNISKNSKFPDYGFSIYYKSYLKYYVYIILSSLIKAVLEYLFLGLFSF